MSNYPVPVDLDALLKRLEAEERQFLHDLARLEARIREFENSELPEYEKWIRLELGPKFSVLDEIRDEIYVQRILARRVNELIDSHHLHPREALYVALAKEPGPEQQRTYQSKAESRSPGNWDQEEIQARRQAKREAKRAERREKKKEKQKSLEGQSPPGRGEKQSIVLYRNLARKLHPDSPIAVQGISASRRMQLWMEVQSAYDADHYERLLAVTAWLQTEHGDDQEEVAKSLKTPLADRFKRIRSMKTGCGRLQKKLSQLIQHPAWEFKMKKGSALRKIRQKAILEIEAEITQHQELLEALEDFIDSIGPPRPPKRNKIGKF